MSCVFFTEIKTAKINRITAVKTYLFVIIQKCHLHMFFMKYYP